LECLDDALKLLGHREMLPEERFPIVLYCVPTFNNPTSSTISDQQRARLVALAKQYNVLIICDEVYDLLYFGSEISHRRMVSFDSLQHGNVISNCSFSKLFGPGLRVGWIEAGRRLMERVSKR
jgi:DNA-binding transcriptional MocR family regulator